VKVAEIYPHTGNFISNDIPFSSRFVAHGFLPKRLFS